ncbi:Elongator complex protein 6, partial [Neolecta irregularis DAH-3]
LNNHLPLGPPEGALYLLTGTLAAPARFLLQHFVINVLNQMERPVLFWSFLVDFANYKSSTRKWMIIKGCNLQSFSRSKKLVFVDGSERILVQYPAKPFNQYGSDANSLSKYLLSCFTAQIEDIAKANSGEIPIVIIENIDILSAVYLLNSTDVLHLVDEIRLVH